MLEALLTIEKVEKMPSPRVIKSHLPFHLLPPDLLDTAKVLDKKIHRIKSIISEYRQGYLRRSQSQRRYRFIFLLSQTHKIGVLQR